eukprot:jgi/Picsp_1/247/NSC_00246-R1_protein
MATSGSGRIQCLLVSTVDGYVIYERFYDMFNDVQKAEIRASLDDAIEGVEIKDNLEVVARFKNGRIVGVVTGNIIFFAMGTGNYDELILRDTLEAVIDALIDMTKSQSLSDLVLFQHYFILVHTLDEVCKEGIVELIDKDEIQKSMNLKMQTYSTENAVDNVRGIMKKFSTKEVKLGR